MAVAVGEALMWWWIACGFVVWAILVALICAFFYGASERRNER